MNLRERERKQVTVSKKNYYSHLKANTVTGEIVQPQHSKRKKMKIAVSPTMQRSLLGGIYDFLCMVYHS